MPKEAEGSEVFTLDLSDATAAPRSQRVESAVRLIRKKVARKFKVSDVKIDSEVNRSLWVRSSSKPPRKLMVQVRVEDDVAHVEPPPK